MSRSCSEANRLCFAHPEPETPKKRILPVFLPFAGCPERCVYCAQQAVTGEKPAELGERLDWLLAELAERRANKAPAIDVAFYGGTFTSLPGYWPQIFLDEIAPFKKDGTVADIRCSTRPDATAPEFLSELKELGLDMVELGIQSFSDAVLAASKRGYTGQEAQGACRRVLDSGLSLGIQLMPGLPGMDTETFQDDASTAIALAPAAVRLYPTMVLDGTALANDWREGQYQPWALEETVEALGQALLQFWKANIPVIRIGLPPEPTLQDYVLAGPQHSALGQLIRSQALFHFIAEKLSAYGQAPNAFLAPSRYQSDFLGHSRSMVDTYAAAGLPIEIVKFVQQKMFEIS